MFLRASGGSRRNSVALGIAAAFASVAMASPAFAESDTVEEATPIVHGLSWDMMAGGIPNTGTFLEAQIGFPSLPRVAYHHALKRGLSIGGSAALDYGMFAPADAFAGSLLLGVPLRYTLFESSSMSGALRVEPGLALGFGQKTASQFIFGLLLNIGANVGFLVDNRFILGGGVEVPMWLGIPTRAGSAFVAAPLLVGPIAEFHVTPPLAVTLDAKIGAHVMSESAIGTRLGFKFLVGAAYRM